MNFNSLPSGKSVENQEIEAFIAEPSKKKKNQKYIYLMGGTHGDEVEGVYVLDKLFKFLKKNESLNLPLVVLPILNIDGYRAETRVNSNGVDLNRNYPTPTWTNEQRAAKYNPGPSALSEPENKFLISLFEKYKPGIIISMHSWKPMINYNGDCKDVADFLNERNNYITCDDIEGHPTPGSLGELGPGTYGAPVITFECPLISDNKLSLKDIWNENEKAFTELMTSTVLDRFIK